MRSLILILFLIFGIQIYSQTRTFTYQVVWIDGSYWKNYGKIYVNDSSIRIIQNDTVEEFNVWRTEMRAFTRYYYFTKGEVEYLMSVTPKDGKILNRRYRWILIISHRGKSPHSISFREAGKIYYSN